MREKGVMLFQLLSRPDINSEYLETQVARFEELILPNSRKKSMPEKQL